MFLEFLIVVITASKIDTERKTVIEHEIEEVEVVGESDNVECIYRFYGQDIDSSVEEDIVESPCYVEKSTAIQELMKAKRNTPRQQWRLETHIIGKCNY